MKILWLSHDSDMSGANVCMSEFLKIISREGIQNYLIVPRHGDMSVAVKDSVVNIRSVLFYSWNWPIGSKPPFLFRVRRWIRNKIAVSDILSIIKSVDPDFIVTNTIVTEVAALAAKKAFKKHIWLIHEFGEEDHGYNIGSGFSSAAKIINTLSYKVGFISRAVQKKYAPFITLGKQSLVHNAILIPLIDDFKSALIPTRLRLVMLGQIAPSKNQLDALKALKLCLEKGLDLTLTIIGRGDDVSYMNLLKNYIHQNNLQSNIQFEGTTNKPQEVLARHELLLMCSRMEAFGRVTVEALKLGIPVIGANAGATGEIVTDGENGYLYQSGNYEDLCEKIFLYNKTKNNFDREIIATIARKKFNAQNTLAELNELFQ